MYVCMCVNSLWITRCGKRACSNSGDDRVQIACVFVCVSFPQCVYRCACVQVCACVYIPTALIKALQCKHTHTHTHTCTHAHTHTRVH